MSTPDDFTCPVCNEKNALHGGTYRGPWGHTGRWKDDYTGRVLLRGEGWDVCFHCWLVSWHGEEYRGHIMRLLPIVADELDKRILALLMAGYGQTGAALHLGVHRNTIGNRLRRLRQCKNLQI